VEHIARSPNDEWQRDRAKNALALGGPHV
jgi:hypothetical protein